MLTRRDLLKSAICIPLVAHLVENSPADAGTSDSGTSVLGMPATGKASASMQAFDEIIVAQIQASNVPGASVAVASQGKLLYARGYGYADTDTKALVQPWSLFRLASVSKPITSAAIVTLLQNPSNGFSLETPVYQYLGFEPFLKPGQKVDPRIWTITINQLLHHTGGYDRSISGDIMFKHFEIAADMKIRLPPDHTSIIRWGLGQKLDFDPGTRFAYSNFGFLVLGRIIEKASGLAYETYVRNHVLGPLGISEMRIGGGRQRDRLPYEVTYYAVNTQRKRSIFPDEADQNMPSAYAFSSPQVMDSNGGWVASSIDMMRFATRLTDPTYGPVVKSDGMDILISRPQPPVGLESNGTPSDVYYGAGWNVRDLHDHGKVNMWHDGIMPGTRTILVRFSNNFCWVLLMNRDYGGDMDALMHKAASKVESWPIDNLFTLYS